MDISHQFRYFKNYILILTWSLWLLAMDSSQVRRRSGEFWYPLAILYMRSMCISGSSEYSFILTVSDRIMLRL